MNILLLTSHSIAEVDDLRMFTAMGIPTFSIGAYTNPAAPTDDKRPALAGAPYFPDLEAACHERRDWHAADDAGQVIDWAKGDLPDEVLAWADTIIVHHFPEAWIGGNWARIRNHRVIWRTCGQSDPRLERAMKPYRDDGLEIVRYSPREAEAFHAMGSFAGQDIVIRFGKEPSDHLSWHGEMGTVGNVTQHMAQRGDSCGYSYYLQATADLPAAPAGPGSEALPGGIGALGYDDMFRYLAASRAYVYTGTRPASYTLGLIEAMMTGVPVVSIGESAFGAGGLFEGHLLTGYGYDNPAGAREFLRALLRDDILAADIGQMQRERALDLFGIQGVMDRWSGFLGTL